MPPRSDRCCDLVVVKAIEAAIPGFKHACASRSSRHKAKPIPLTVINEYCTAVNGTITTLSGDGEYKICYLMKKLFIKTSPNAADPPGVGVTIPGTHRPDPPVARTRPPRPQQTMAIPLESVALLCCPGPWSQNRKQHQKLQ